LYFNKEATYIVPLREVLQVALQIAERKGIDRIGNGWILSALLGRGGVETTSKQEAESLLHRALAVPPLPSAWSAAVVRLCLEAGLDHGLLLRLWRHGRELHGRYWEILKPELTDRWHEIVVKLLALGQSDALHLASRIIASGHTRREIVGSLVSQMMATTPANKAENYARIGALLAQILGPEEFRFWARWDEATADGCGEWPRLFRRVLERFEEAAEAGNSLDSDELREQLAPIIVQRRRFPWQIPCAALETILKLDERNVPPLQDGEWQQEL